MSNFKDNSGLETIKPKTSKEERDRMMKKFLDKGGKVQKLKQVMHTNVGSLDKSKKPAFTKDDIDKGVKGQAPRPDYSTYKKVRTMTMTWVVINHLYGKKQPKNEMGGK